MTDQTPINVGLAGLGRTGWNNHANAFAHLPEQFRVVAVCDPDPATPGRSPSNASTASPTLPMTSLVADKAVELMVVATPSNLHAEQSIAAMRAGQHVIVEKPMASDLAGADAMIAVAKETGRIPDRAPEPSLRLRFRQSEERSSPPASSDASSKSASTTAVSTAVGTGRLPSASAAACSTTAAPTSSTWACS